MQSLVVDTNSVIKKLEQRGFSRAAEGITEALKELDASSLATKTDLKDLEIILTCRLACWISTWGPLTARLFAVDLRIGAYPSSSIAVASTAPSGSGQGLLSCSS